MTIDVEIEGKIAFLDTLVTQNRDRSGYTVYRKPTYADRYLHNNIDHHPRHDQGITENLVERARRIYEPENLATELNLLMP